MLSLEKNKASTHELVSLAAGKGDQLSEEFQLFVEQSQFSQLCSKAEIQYKNLHSTLSLANRTRKHNLKLYEDQLENVMRESVVATSEGTRRRKFVRLLGLSVNSASILTGMDGEASSCAGANSQELLQKISEVESKIFAENMQRDILESDLQVHKEAKDCLRSKLQALRRQNEQLALKTGWYSHVRNVARCQTVSNKALVEHGQKQYQLKNKKDAERIQKWHQKSRSLYRSREHLKMEYLKETSRIQELQDLNSLRVHQLKRISLETPHLGKKDQVTPIIYDIEELIKLIKEHELNFLDVVLETCGRNIARLRVAASMDEARASQIRLINNFEEQHSFKVESAYKLVLHFYKKLKESQKSIVSEFDERSNLKQEKEEELRNLQRKYENIVLGVLGTDTPKRSPSHHCKEAEMDSLLKQAQDKSQFVIELMQFLVGILRKFKLVFEKLENAEMEERVGGVIGMYMTREEDGVVAASPLANRKELINDTTMFRLMRTVFREIDETTIREALQLLRCRYGAVTFLTKELMERQLNDDCEPATSSLRLRQSRLFRTISQLFDFIERTLERSSESLSEDLHQMLSLFAVCYSQLKQRQPSSTRRRNLLKIPATAGHKTNYYSEFLTSGKDDPVDEKPINSKQDLKEESDARDLETEIYRPSIIQKFMRAAAKPISAEAVRVILRK